MSLNKTSLRVKEKNEPCLMCRQPISPIDLFIKVQLNFFSPCFYLQSFKDWDSISSIFIYIYQSEKINIMASGREGIYYILIVWGFSSTKDLTHSIRKAISSTVPYLLPDRLTKRGNWITFWNDYNIFIVVEFKLYTYVYISKLIFLYPLKYSS